MAGVAGGLAIGFYLRNRSLYGSLTGAAYNQRLFRFQPQDHVLALLRSPAYWLRLSDGLWVWTRFNLPRVPAVPLLVAVPRGIGLLAVAGLAVAAAGACAAPAGRRDLPAVAAWALVLAWPVAVFAMVASYDGNGGHTHPRYLFPAWPCSRSGARSASTGSPAPAAACGSSASRWRSSSSPARPGRLRHRPRRPSPRRPGRPPAQHRRPARRRRRPRPMVVLGLAGILLVTALGLLATAVARLAPPPPPPAPLRRHERVPALELPDAP